MATAFKVGDRVRCVATSRVSAPGVGGREYEVSGVSSAGAITLLGEGSWVCVPDRFELVTPAAPVPQDAGATPAEPVPKDADVIPASWLNGLSSDARKEVAVARGLFAYFPDALALVARHSVRSNEKHNPGQPVHWSREKSNDHEDCIARHSLSVAVDPNALDGDVPHIVCRAWRALAALQLWVEAKKKNGELV